LTFGLPTNAGRPSSCAFRAEEEEGGGKDREEKKKNWRPPRTPMRIGSKAAREDATAREGRGRGKGGTCQHVAIPLSDLCNQLFSERGKEGREERKNLHPPLERSIFT